MKRDEQVWQASDARNNLPEVMDRALSGTPQFIRHRSGREVVVLSRAAYDALRPTMREYLLRGGSGPDDDPLDRYIDEQRGAGPTVLGPADA